MVSRGIQLLLLTTTGSYLSQRLQTAQHVPAPYPLGPGIDPAVSFESVHLKGPDCRIHQPDMADLLAGIDRFLLDPVPMGSCGRKHLTHPIWSQLEIRYVLEGRQSLTSPTGKVRHKNVRTRVKLRLKKNPLPAQSTRSTRTACKRPSVLSNRPSRKCMR